MFCVSHGRNRRVVLGMHRKRVLESLENSVNHICDVQRGATTSIVLPIMLRWLRILSQRLKGGKQ